MLIGMAGTKNTLDHGPPYENVNRPRPRVDTSTSASRRCGHGKRVAATASASSSSSLLNCRVFHGRRNRWVRLTEFLPNLERNVLPADAIPNVDRKSSM